MRRTIRRHAMVPAAGRVLVAVSGGADSVALLAALVEAATRLRATVLCGHFNHRLRAADADADEGYVAELCARLRVPLYVGRAERPLAGPALEARARRQRYAFLRRVAADLGARRIATAHTLDDQAETVLMRLLRGSGAAGLQAIRFRRGPIIRPLLECSRASVLDYLEARSLQFRVDASNDDRRFLRNRVRHDVLPCLAAINPRVREALARSAATLQLESAHLDAQAAAATAVLVQDGRLQVVGIDAWGEPMRRRIVRRWLRSEGVRQLGHEQTLAVLALLGASPGATVPLPGNVRVARVDEALQLERTS